jgi:hypothetical protein
MNKFFAIFNLIVILLSLSAQAQQSSNVRKIIKYKKYTEVDLSGSSVEGKARTPELFYIFQRKRSQGHDTVTLPTKFKEHHAFTRQAASEGL